MLRVFQNDLYEPGHFVVTLELVPGREATGRAVDAVMGIAREAFADGRVSAVSITDNPGGNPSLSPDVLGYEIFNIGMDVIVHFTCRDMNRVGMESRALQLARMGMKNILALNGDFSGQGFGGQGAPVFDLDSVQLQIMLDMLSDRLHAAGDPDPFFAGCAVSPFKQTEAETFAQYAKLCRKVSAGARFIITQLGYDARKFKELVQICDYMNLEAPLIGSVYVLKPKAAAIMNAGRVPGAVVTDALLERIRTEWRDKAAGRAAAIERAARLAAVLKGLGYGGIHIGGIHGSFDEVGRILDRLEQIQGQWQAFLADFDYPQAGGFYAFPKDRAANWGPPKFGRRPLRVPLRERFAFNLLSGMHDIVFNREHPWAPMFERLCRRLDGRIGRQLLTELVEDPAKQLLLDCQKCGDCAIQHVGFLCPESQCPKHTRNGACGGSCDGRCEVFPERYCVWYRAYLRLSHAGETVEMVKRCVPPRMWELNKTSSWLNYHLQRDHQGSTHTIALRCRARSCTL
ncbi:methylenetetrahydrofolate reductase C-terminal domain-containing protein [Desulfatitalea tepidiphila]|uniref:methylenetetrahydrofolate reductase C-terminal domain-containing protein n=1 Tax=Desulfatitalea tepidiphila TaxID=1185843 RepID=UPI0006B501C3|nr:methylenetetrahydrofolate reductase C-terminal domain-containing protein [Desulfatitalea tepidiphila]